jgi:tripartite ATP-independent transporter DctP family solute receptor
MKKIFILLVLAVAVLAVSQPVEAKTVIRFATYYAPTHPVSNSIEYFKKGLEEESGGRFEVQHFGNSQLGPEDVFTDQTRRGAVQMCAAGGMVRKDEPLLSLTDLPFILQTWDQARKIFNGPIGEKIKGKYAEKTTAFIAGYMANGFGEISSNFPIATMEDLKKLKLRANSTEMYVRLFKSFGCNPVIMPINEIYNALETKTVDGQANAFPLILTAGWWEVQPYILESRHAFATNQIVVNKRFYASLNAQDKALFDKWVQKMVEHNWDISEKSDEEAKAELIAKGIKIQPLSPEMRKQMADSLTEFYEWYTTEYVPGSKELIEEIRSAIQ